MQEKSLTKLSWEKSLLWTDLSNMELLWRFPQMGCHYCGNRWVAITAVIAEIISGETFDGEIFGNAAEVIFCAGGSS